MISDQPGDRQRNPSEDAGTWRQPRPDDDATQQVRTNPTPRVESFSVDSAGAGRVPARVLGPSGVRGHFLAYRLDRFLARAIAIPVAVMLWLVLLSPLLILAGVLTLGGLFGGDSSSTGTDVRPVPAVSVPGGDENAYCPDGRGGFTTPDPDTGDCPGG